MFSDLIFRLRALFRRNEVEAELDEELRAHFERQVEKYMSEGARPEEATRRARIEFGGFDQVKEECREARGVNFIETLIQDVRYGLRVLRKSPGFTAIAVITIAVGIAANVSVFGFVDALFLRSVPAKDAAGLVRIEGEFSFPEYAYLRDHAKTLQQVVAHYSTAPLYVTANGETGEVQSAVVSSSYFEMLGLQPRLGRFFTSAEDSVADRDAVALIGHGFWQRMYNGETSALGKTLVINGRTFEIVGIMPASFHGVLLADAPNEIWIPAMMIGTGYRSCDGFMPGCTVLSLMGRLAAGKSTAQAQAEVATLLRQLRTTAEGFDERERISVVPAAGIAGGRDYFAPIASLLTAIAGFLLVIVCANLGALLVARGMARGPEIAMRQALGAGRRRIVRQLLTESLLLSCAGGALGVLISLWTSDMLAGFYSVDAEGYRHLIDIRPDASVLIYSVAVAILAGVMFGLLPALQASRTDLNQVLKSGGAAAGSGRSRTRTLLVTVQVALSLALLVGAGLLARSTARLSAGANMDLWHVLGVRLRPQLLHYPPAQAAAFKREVVRRLRELPGVESVSLAKGQGLVWHDNLAMRMTLPGNIYPKRADEPVILYHQIAPDYFATLRIPFVAGRDFNDGERPGSPQVAIVNETLARQISPGELPLGHTILLDGQPYQIVGVVKDAQWRSALEGPVPVAYLPFWQDATLVDARMCIRVPGDPNAALPMIRKEIASIDAYVSVTEAMPLIEQMRGEFADARVAGAVLAFAAALGLLLSAMGLYGVIAYEASRRTREIGLRMALGAQPRQVLRLFLIEGLNVILLGIAVGGALAFATTRLLRAWLFGVGPSDPAAFLVAVGALLSVVLLASYIPARRAMRVDPMVALRHE